MPKKTAAAQGRRIAAACGALVVGFGLALGAVLAAARVVAAPAAEKEDAVKLRLLEPLHEGPGLAAKHPGDAGLAKDPAVLFVEDFEADGLERRWDELKSMPATLKIVDAKGEAHGGRRALRLEYHAGRDSGGHLYRKLERGENELYLRFYVRFPDGHPYVHHFVHLGGYDPPTAWPQGGAGERPRGDERFSSGIDLHGDWGKTPPPGRWGFYSYWCEMPAANDGKFWGQEPQGAKAIRAECGKWTCVEVMLKLNRTGERDGEQAFWIDGRCAGRWSGYRWRTKEELKLNFIWLLYYMSAGAAQRNRGADTDSHVLFDDVVVARRYIGPMAERGKH